MRPHAPRDVQHPREPPLLPGPGEPSYELVKGFEDVRLFAWREGLWCCATVRDLTPQGWCEQVLARLETEGPGPCWLTDWRLLHPPGPRLHEKNWMPQVVPAPAEAGGDRLQFIYLCDPTRIIDDQARTIVETPPAIAAEQFSGGSLAIAFDAGWLALVHEAPARPPLVQRCYQHRFVWFDEVNALRRVSRAFFFHHKDGVEFAAGLAWHPDGKRLLVSYGVDDKEAWIGTVDVEEVRKLLEEVDRLPFGLLPAQVEVEKHRAAVLVDAASVDVWASSRFSASRWTSARFSSPIRLKRS